jgi:predicted amidohydrolase YtcJ
LHLIRGGLNYNLELRWEGVPSLMPAHAQGPGRSHADAAMGAVVGLERIPVRRKTHADPRRTQPGRARYPGVRPAPDRALLNGAARWPVMQNPPGGEIVRDANGEPTGMLVARPNAMILYSTLAKGPKLPLEYQVNSTRQFMRELNRLA